MLHMEYLLGECVVCAVAPLCSLTCTNVAYEAAARIRDLSLKVNCFVIINKLHVRSHVELGYGQ